MRRLVTIVMLCAGCLMTASAQTFTQRIQQKGGVGEGTVTISQDKAIDDLVNGKGTATATQAEPQKEKKEQDASLKKSEARVQEQMADTAVSFQQVDARRKVMLGGYKINGFRVQAFAGGNQRKDRQKAEQIGNTIKANYPDEPIYVHFYSPRWICRVGNYRTYEEAHEMLMNIRKLGIVGASIVKGKITVSSY
ncbi:MAG: SPOR domain-containing protein [Prevotella sp.]|nr:SPOR domain-containing protein [Prevotella sp.]